MRAGQGLFLRWRTVVALVAAGRHEVNAPEADHFDLEFPGTNDAATEMTMKGMMTQKAGSIGRKFSAPTARTR